MFSLNDLGGSGGLTGVSESRGSGIVSALENIGINFAAGAATVGLSALAKSQGVSQAYANPAAVAYNTSVLTRPPGQVSPIGAALGVSGDSLLLAGVLLVGGLVAFAALLRRKG